MTGSYHTGMRRLLSSVWPAADLSVWEGGPPGDALLVHLRKTGHKLELDKDGQLMFLWGIPQQRTGPGAVGLILSHLKPLFSQLVSLIQGVPLPGAFLLLHLRPSDRGVTP